MDVGDIASIASAAVAVAAFSVSAYLSLRAARAAERSADAAGESAAVARDVRDRGDAPAFDITSVAPSAGNWQIKAEVLSGPPSIRVQASVMGESVKKDEGGGGEFGHMIGMREAHYRQAARGTKFEIDVECMDGATHNEARVILHSIEDGVEEPRDWWAVREIRWDKPRPKVIV
jgi:hypothetical protein